MKRLGKPLTVVIGVVLVGLVIGPWVYINLIRDEAPKRLALTSTTVAADTTDDRPVADGVSGEWIVGSASQVGYRVKEILFGQSTEGVGRTNDVEGTLTIEGTNLAAAEFTVRMASLESDDARRDGKFRGEIMDTARFPTATFVLTQAIAIPESALSGGAFTTEAVGDLTLRGQTRSVTLTVEGRLSDGTIEVAGSINIVFADWGIPNPSNPAITTEDNGELEFLLLFSRP